MWLPLETYVPHQARRIKHVLNDIRMTQTCLSIWEQQVSQNQQCHTLSWQRNWSLLLQGKLDVVFLNALSKKCKIQFPEQRHSRAYRQPSWLYSHTSSFWALGEPLLRCTSEVSCCPYSCRDKHETGILGRSVLHLAQGLFSEMLMICQGFEAWWTSPFRPVWKKIRT